ncbi:MAG: DinB family protein [Calditrichia bacterium]|jgi:hypothetical protein|nr:DinB family protein [Calditrichia bacterium]
MDYNYFISSLENSAKKIESLLEGVSEEQAKWKPQPEKWSILEVVNHLYDEERDDFRRRLDLTINTPDKDWPSIDPEGWVRAHEYYKKDYHQSVRNFLNERTKSLKWLKALSDPDWKQTHNHPAIGPLVAADLLAAWATHDYLHLRQLSDLQARYLNILASPFSTKYASP